MRPFVLIILLISSLTTVASGYAGISDSELIDKVDSALVAYQLVASEKLAQIGELKASLQRETDDNAQYGLIKNIYDLYAQVNADSALVYANRGLEMAQNTRDDTTVADWLIKRQS